MRWEHVTEKVTMSKDLKEERAGAMWGLEEEPSRQRAKVLRQELPVCSKRAEW